ncbi:MAG TPA: VWA domain-containing protein [Acidimicrobiales bacterium]|nr:VWA domain-containing protein [Acidimicrobiales bacterium]
MNERERRWRLVLGGAAQEDGDLGGLSPADAAMDAALAALYEPGASGLAGGPRGGGLEASAPRVARWLGDIRSYFPSSVVRVLQQDAIERLDLRQLLLEPEVLDAVEPDVHLVATLLALNSVLPEETRATARLVVRRVVDDLERRLAQHTRQAVRGAVDRSARGRRPRHHEIDWDKTVRANLRHWQPAQRALIPETLVGYGRRQQSVPREIVLCVDQSGSMAASVVFAAVFAAVMAGLRALHTRLVVFDTSVVDLTEHLYDPVDLLFATQLGGGTDIAQALAYCQSVVTRPTETVLVLISDLVEGGSRDDMLRRAAELVAAGVTVVALLALSYDGAPAYDHENAAALAALGIPAFACSPDRFPELMAAAIERRDLSAWHSAF